MSFQAVTAYERFVARAKDAVSGAPYWKFIDNEEFARLGVEDDVATLTWLDISSGYYGSWETDSCSISFPASILALSDEDFAAWKAEEDAKYKREKMEREQAEKAAAAAAKKAHTEAVLTHGVIVDGKRYKLVPNG